MSRYRLRENILQAGINRNVCRGVGASTDSRNQKDISSMYIYLDNKYTKWYYAIIQAAQNRRLEPNIRVEKHHIIPKSLGGGNEAGNIVTLTLQEHFICHRLLPKMCTGKDQHKMIYAAWNMVNTRDIRATGRTYAVLKEQVANILSDSKKGVPTSPPSEETSKKISETNKKRWQEDPERRRLASIRQTGKPVSAETCEKMSIIAKERIKRLGPIPGSGRKAGIVGSILSNPAAREHFKKLTGKEPSFHYIWKNPDHALAALNQLSINTL